MNAFLAGISLSILSLHAQEPSKVDSSPSSSPPPTGQQSSLEVKPSKPVDAQNDSSNKPAAGATEKQEVEPAPDGKQDSAARAASRTSAAKRAAAARANRKQVPPRDRNAPLPPADANPGAEAGPQPGTPAEEAAAPIVLQRPRPPLMIPTYRVTIRTKGGRRFSGLVIRDAKFRKHVEAGDHLGRSLYSSPESFRVHYVDDLDGQIMFHWNEIRELQIREVLDLAALKSLEEKYQQSRLVNAGAAATETQTTEGSSPPEGSTGKSSTESGKPDASPTDPAALLAEFAPDQGWSPERRDQILWRKTIVGVFPQENESRFLEVFDAWKPAYEQWLKAHPEHAQPKTDGADGKPPRSENDPPEKDGGSPPETDREDETEKKGPEDSKDPDQKKPAGDGL